jgi:hypothetical protein
MNPSHQKKKQKKQCKENNTKKANQIINRIEFLPVASETIQEEQGINVQNVQAHAYAPNETK